MAWIHYDYVDVLISWKTLQILLTSLNWVLSPKRKMRASLWSSPAWWRGFPRLRCNGRETIASAWRTLLLHPSSISYRKALLREWTGWIRSLPHWLSATSLTSTTVRTSAEASTSTIPRTWSVLWTPRRRSCPFSVSNCFWFENRAIRISGIACLTSPTILLACLSACVLEFLPFSFFLSGFLFADLMIACLLP